MALHYGKGRSFGHTNRKSQGSGNGGEAVLGNALTIGGGVLTLGGATVTIGT